MTTTTTAPRRVLLAASIEVPDGVDFDEVLAAVYAQLEDVTLRAPAFEVTGSRTALIALGLSATDYETTEIVVLSNT